MVGLLVSLFRILRLAVVQPQDLQARFDRCHLLLPEKPTPYNSKYANVDWGRNIDIAAHRGLSPFAMSMMRRRRTDHSATQKASPDEVSRTKRLNRIIDTSKLKRHEVVRLTGITPFHLSRVLANS